MRCRLQEVVDFCDSVRFHPGCKTTCGRVPLNVKTHEGFRVHDLFRLRTKFQAVHVEGRQLVVWSFLFDRKTNTTSPIDNLIHVGGVWALNVSVIGTF